MFFSASFLLFPELHFILYPHVHFMHEQGRVISHVLLSSHQNFILLNISRGKSNEVLAQSFYCSIKYDYILGTVSLASFDNLYFLN